MHTTKCFDIVTTLLAISDTRFITEYCSNFVNISRVEFEIYFRSMSKVHPISSTCESSIYQEFYENPYLNFEY